jgi:hypothetical protein
VYLLYLPGHLLNEGSRDPLEINITPNSTNNMVDTKDARSHEREKQHPNTKESDYYKHLIK